MKIGVLSDTHINSLNNGTTLAKHLLDGPFHDVEMILHAGDHTIEDFYLCFPNLPYYGVCGNMDRRSPRLPQRRIVEIGDVKIAMIHGDGAFNNIEEHVLNSFKKEAVNVIIFGHTHQPFCQQVGSILLLNPGSAADRRSAPYHSVAVLTIAEDIHAEIFAID